MLKNIISLIFKAIQNVFFLPSLIFARKYQARLLDETDKIVNAITLQYNSQVNVQAHVNNPSHSFEFKFQYRIETPLLDAMLQDDFARTIQKTVGNYYSAFHGFDEHGTSVVTGDKYVEFTVEAKINPFDVFGSLQEVS